jgi:choline transport protein
LAPKKYARFLSYTTGYLGWAGAVVVSGSVAVGLAQAVVGMIILANPNVPPLSPENGAESDR